MREPDECWTNQAVCNQRAIKSAGCCNADEEECGREECRCSKRSERDEPSAPDDDDEDGGDGGECERCYGERRAEACCDPATTLEADPDGARCTDHGKECGDDGPTACPGLATLSRECLHGEDGERPLQDVARCDNGGATTTERSQCVRAAGASRADRSRVGTAGEARHKEAERDRARKVGA